jgi:PIN like domain
VRHRSARQPDPEFFIDRSLGYDVAAEALRTAGLIVHTLASVYGEREAQSVTDERWLEFAGDRDWVVLMKDDSIRRRPRELAALSAAGVRAFCVTNANLTGAQYADLFVRHRHRIIQRSRHPGPYVYGVYTEGLRKLWP